MDDFSYRIHYSIAEYNQCDEIRGKDRGMHYYILIDLNDRNTSSS